MSNNKGGFGKFVVGAAVGVGLGMLFAPDTGENTRKVLKKKINELLDKIKEVDLDEVKDEMLFKIDALQVELATLDKEKVKAIALKQAKIIREKAEELYKYVIEKGTPVVEKAADEVRKQALKVVKDIQTSIEKSGQTKLEKK